jgi:hypothetical protein
MYRREVVTTPMRSGAEGPGDKGYTMRIMKPSSALLVVLVVLVGLVALPAFAQESVDADGYPLEIDGDVIVDDDVTVVEDEVLDGIVVADDTEVSGRRLALTGGQLLALIVAGLALLTLGGVSLAATRRRRSAKPV